MVCLENYRQQVIDKLEDFVYNVFYTKDGEHIKLANYQADIIRNALSREKNKFVVISATRAGKSEAVSILALLLAMFYVGEEIVIITPILKQAKDGIFQRIRSHIKNNGGLVRLVTTMTQDKIEFRNGSKIYCLTAKNEDGLLGHGANVVIVDEAGSIVPRIIKERVLRMLTTRRERKNLLFLIGTPHNMESYLYEAWNSEDFVKYRITWREAVEAGIMSKEDVEFAKKTIREDEFAAWYEAEWRQLNDELFFDMSAVRDACEIEKRSYKTEDLKGFEIVLGFDPAGGGRSKSCVVAVGRLKNSDDDKL